MTHKMLHSVAQWGEKVEQEVSTKATTDRRSLKEAVGDRFQVGVGNRSGVYGVSKTHFVIRAILFLMPRAIRCRSNSRCSSIAARK